MNLKLIYKLDLWTKRKRKIAITPSPNIGSLNIIQVSVFFFDVNQLGGHNLVVLKLSHYIFCICHYAGRDSVEDHVWDFKGQMWSGVDYLHTHFILLS